MPSPRTRGAAPRLLALRLSVASLVMVATVATPVLAQQPAATAAAARHAVTFEDFAAVANVSDPQLSPDGARVLYAVRTTDVGANRRTTVTWVVPFAGGAARRWPDDTTRATEARWSPDGSRVAYVAGGQLWVADASGANRRRLTSLTGGATGPVWAPAGDRVAFTSSVYPGCRDEACNARLADSAEKSVVKAHVADQLLYRHWTAWDEGTRSHLFVVPIAGGAPADLTPGVNYDVPPGPFGGSEGYAWSPDGRELAYTAKDAGREAAWSTDINVYLVPATGGAPVVITETNRGADQNPVYSPDGRFIAYASQERAGFEADRGRLMLYDRAARTARELLPSWDRSAAGYAFTADSRTLIVTSDEAARDKIFRVALDARGMAQRPTPEVLVGTMNNVAPSLSRDGRALVWQRDAANRPAEVWAATVGPKGVTAPRALTHLNDALVARLDVAPVEEIWYRGAGGDSVHALFMRPPGWRAGQKYPLILLVHGGPQGAWLDTWHGRWNYAMFAATGAAVLAVNPHGSTGYGQKYTDAVSKDWGGKAYEDLMEGVDAALAKYDWLDSTRMGAAGGSYGGYMTNWLAGHTTRFKALVTHAGVFNLESMYGATEEIWFPEWEYGGPYWQSKQMEEQYRKWSPHLSAQNFRTPTLVLHGELDYRVPYYEGVSMFTALQRQNVPSRLVIFPDEGHWIGKPQNQRLWWSEVQGWLSRWLQTGKPSAE